MFLSEWSEFPFASCRAGAGNLMTVRVSMLLKSLALLTCFRACFLPGRAKDLSAPWYFLSVLNCHDTSILRLVLILFVAIGI